MKSSSPPPPRAAALRSRRGGGDGPSARPPEPRGVLALHPHPRGRHSGGSTRTPLPRRLAGAARFPGGTAAGRGSLLDTAAGWAVPPRASLALSGVPSAGSGERGAPAQRPAARGPLPPPPPSPCPSPRPRRPAQPGRTGLSGEERGRAGSRSAARPEPRESLPPGELCVCVRVPVLKENPL